MSKLRAALLDADGVLVDSEPIYEKATYMTFKPYGIEMSHDEYLSLWVINLKGTQWMLDKYGQKELKDAPLERIRKERDIILHQLIDSELEMMLHAEQLLERMGRYSLALAVVSTEHRNNLEKKLGKFGFWERFDVSVCGGEAERGKHYPDPWRKAIELLKPTRPDLWNLQPEECLVIEDNYVGIKSASEAGCRTIAFPNGPTLDMEFPGADETIYSLADIDTEMLLRLFPG